MLERWIAALEAWRGRRREKRDAKLKQWQADRKREADANFRRKVALRMQELRVDQEARDRLGIHE